MANFNITSCPVALIENKLDFQSLYLHRIVSGDKKNQYVVIDGFGTTDLGLTTINDWAIYDGVAPDAKLVARAKGMRMNAADWCNSFTIVFELDRFKGSTLVVMGATAEEQGEWAIVGGTGEFAMARGVIHRKIHQKLADGDVLELTIDAFCRMKGQQQTPATIQPIQPPVQPRPTTNKPIQPPLQPCCAPTLKMNGPWGGTGEKLHDLGLNMSLRLNSVTVIYYRAVNGLSFTYIGQDVQVRTSKLIGNNGFGGDTKRHTVKLGPTEFVMQLSGTYEYDDSSKNTAMSSLKLVTNLGKTHGPFGANKGTRFNFSVPPNNSIVGFFGESTGYAVNSIGAYTLKKSA